jgi:TolB protein
LTNLLQAFPSFQNQQSEDQSLTCRTDAVIGDNSSFRMKPFVLLLGYVLLVGAAIAQNSSSPIITIRKGTAVVVAIKDAAGPAAAVLKNDIELSGALTLGDSASATVLASVTGSGNGVSAQAVDKTGSVVLQKNYGGDSRRAVHQFVDELVETLSGQKGIASSKIAFVSNRTGHKEIYTADYDGAGAVQLTRDNAISVNPNLSSDGRKLAYTGYQSGYADIYLVDLASGSRNRIIKYPGTNSGPAISPQGNRIACTMSKDGNPEIYVTNINGDSPRRLTRARGVESSPSWSPSGSELVYSSDERGGPQIYRMSVDGGSSRLLSTGFGYCTEPNWSPDGKKIAFNVRSGGAFQVAVLDLDGGSARVIANDGERPVWGPDSRHVLFARGNGLFMIDSVTGREARIIGDLGRVSEPTWSR